MLDRRRWPLFELLVRGLGFERMQVSAPGKLVSTQEFGTSRIGSTTIAKMTVFRRRGESIEEEISSSTKSRAEESLHASTSTSTSSSRSTNARKHVTSPPPIQYNGELIPGLPNELSIEQISTKVPWGTLLSLSRRWRFAVDSGDVHEARIRARTTHFYVAMVHCIPCIPSTSVPIIRSSSEEEDFEEGEDLEEEEEIPLAFDQVVSLYSPSTNTWHQLPPIPGVEEGVPHLCECVYLNGRLYIIGGCAKKDGFHASKQVYSINLRARKPAWLFCAEMLQPRDGFSSGVMDGKIYVFGGMGFVENDVLPQGEVYDPHTGAWSPLTPMQLSSDGDTPIIEEAFTLDRFFLARCAFRDERKPRFVEIYNPEKDQWWKLDRDINTFGPGTFMMTVGGNFYFFEHNNVVFYDFRTRCPTAQHNSLKVTNESRTLGNGHVLHAAPAGGGELLTLQYWESHRAGGTNLFRSKGLGKPKTSLEWESIACVHEFDSRYTRMCVVEI